MVLSTLLVMLAPLWNVSQAAPSLPDEIKSLNEVVGDATALVDGVRKFDREQCKLADWDLDLAKKHAEAGEKDLAKDKQEQARARVQNVRQAWEFVLSKYNNDARAQNYYGEVLYDYFGEAAGAIKAWQLSCALDPKLSTPYNNLGIHYCHIGEYARGLENYDKAISLEPDNPDYLFNLVQTYLINTPAVMEYRKWDKPRVYREALKLSKKATTLSPQDFELAQDYAVNFFAAEEFKAKPNWKEAAKAWQATRALARNPDETFYTWLNEARVHVRGKSWTQAQACLDEALRIRPDSQVAQKLLDDIEKEAGSKGSNFAKKKPAAGK